MINLKERKRLIDFVEQDDNFFKEIGSDLAFEWEKYLISDYWKNWREEIKSARFEEDAELLVYKVLELRSLINWNTSAYKKGICDAERLEESIEVKEKELQNITRKEWEFVEKIGKEVDRFLRGGLMAKNNYVGWSEEELICEIYSLKEEIEKLKTIKVDGDYEKIKVKEFSQKLRQHLANSQSCLNSFQGITSKNNFPILPVISVVGGIVLIVTLISYKVKKSRK